MPMHMGFRWYDEGNDSVCEGYKAKVLEPSSVVRPVDAGFAAYSGV